MAKIIIIITLVNNEIAEIVIGHKFIIIAAQL